MLVEANSQADFELLRIPKMLHKHMAFAYKKWSYFRANLSMFKCSKLENHLVSARNVMPTRQT